VFDFISILLAGAQLSFEFLPTTTMMRRFVFHNTQYFEFFGVA